jgi:hypothetical protein
MKFAPHIAKIAAYGLHNIFVDFLNIKKESGAYARTKL